MMYELTVAFRHLDPTDEDTLYQLDQAMPGGTWFVRDDDACVAIAVEAPSPLAAALEVEARVREVVPQALASHVVEDLVAIPDIADRVGVDRETVRHWVNGTRGPGSFPRPRGVVGDRVKVWDWSDVNEWLRRRLNRVVDEHRLLTAAEAGIVNEVLDPLPDGVAAGVGITPEEVTGVLTDHTGRILWQSTLTVASPGTPEQAVAAVATLLAGSPPVTSDGNQVTSQVLGVHVGGHVNGGEVVLAPRYQSGANWTRINLRAMLEEATNLPTFVQNDANALALYERFFGIGAKAQTFVVVFLNVGVGAGIVVNGKLLTGSQGAAGEIGHLVVALGGYECACGNINCLECVSGVSNLIRAIAEATRRDVSGLGEALRRAEDFDKALEPLRLAGEALGRAASMVLNLVNPSHLVLYAPTELLDRSGKGALFMDELRKALAQYSFSTSKECELIPKISSKERIAIGAAIGALRQPR